MIGFLIVLSRVMRKPVFSYAKTNAQISCAVTDQRFCFRHKDSSQIQNFKTLVICGCTARFVSDLVGFSEYRFSLDETHIVMAYDPLNH